jgi:hypothetical protein
VATALAAMPAQPAQHRAHYALHELLQKCLLTVEHTWLYCEHHAYQNCLQMRAPGTASVCRSLTLFLRT